MVERRQQDPGSQLDVVGGCGQGRHDREERGEVAVAGAMVFADPRRIEPKRLREPDHVQDLPVLADEGPIRVRRHLGREQADPDLKGHARTLTQRALSPHRGPGGCSAGGQCLTGQSNSVTAVAMTRRTLAWATAR